MRFLRNLFSKLHESDEEKAFRYALIALGYYRRAYKENPKIDGILITLEGTKHLVQIL